MRVLIFLVVLFLPASAMAQAACNHYEVIATLLAKKYHEAPIGRSVNRSGSMIELFASEDRSTWTIVVTNSTKRACAVNSGDNWQEIPFQLEDGEPL